MWLGGGGTLGLALRVCTLGTNRKCFRTENLPGKDDRLAAEVWICQINLQFKKTINLTLSASSNG